jgi:putative hydrolase of the HAD superfamily
MTVEAVLFDLFDTLLLLESGDTYYEPCLRKMYAFLFENNVNVGYDDFSRVYFEVRERLYSESRKTLEEPHFNVRVSETLQKLGYDYDASHPIAVGATKAFAEEFMRYVRLDNEATNVLKELRGRYKLGLVSNFNIPECGRDLLKRFGLKQYFDTVVISGEINRRKPSPDIFQKALQHLGVPASRAVFVGDMPDLDVEGPKKAGIKAVLIERKPLEPDINAKPDLVIRHLAELPSVLDSM